MTKITDKKKANRTIIILMLVYMVSYMTRIDFEALISEIVRSEGIEKSLASISVTCLFIVYGVGQLISGFLGEKIQPKRLIAIGFLTTAVMNIIVTLFSNVYFMAAVWSVNGLAQAFMWPPLVKLMTEIFDEETYKKSAVRVSWGSSIGTIAVYLLGPVCIHLFAGYTVGGRSMGWRSMFYICSALAIIMMFIVLKICPEIDVVKNTQQLNLREEGSRNSKIPFFVFFIMIAIVLQGMLRDGVTTWTPSLLSETFSLPVEHSILTGVCIPVFSIAAFWIVSVIHRKKFKNEVLFSGIIFALGTISAAALTFLNGKSPALSVGLSALLTGCMHGVNLMLICLLPGHFKKSGNVSFISGLLNFCTYVGSSIAIYVIAKLTEKYGWSVTTTVWCAIAAMGSIICFSCSNRWKKFSSQND